MMKITNPQRNDRWPVGSQYAVAWRLPTQKLPDEMQIAAKVCDQWHVVASWCDGDTDCLDVRDEDGQPVCSFIGGEVPSGLSCVMVSSYWSHLDAECLSLVPVSAVEPALPQA